MLSSRVYRAGSSLLGCGALALRRLFTICPSGYLCCPISENTISLFSLSCAGVQKGEADPVIFVWGSIDGVQVSIMPIRGSCAAPDLFPLRRRCYTVSVGGIEVLFARV